MSIPLTINGVTFSYPQEFDVHWGPTLTNWSTAVTNGMLQTSGINAATLIKSATTNPADAGFLRLAKTDAISWRNNLNNGNLDLTIDSSNQLTFNGTPIGTAATLTHNHIFVGTAGNTLGDVALSGDATIVDTGALTIANSAITNAKVSASAAIALSKLAALTASKIGATDSSGILTTTSACTLTELGYVSGVTSSIQTQIDAATSALTGYLPLAGGAMSGIINMASHKITSVSNGTSVSDAVAFGQVSGFRVLQVVSFNTSVSKASTSNIYVATNLTATITPSSTASKVLVCIFGDLELSSNVTSTAIAKVVRNGVDNYGNLANPGGTGPNVYTQVAMMYYDAPASVSALTYTVFITNNAGSATVTWGGRVQQTILLIEIG